MEIKLAESIRTFRKERSLTQEQLAEVLGVTVGAVYKWAAGVSDSYSYHTKYDEPTVIHYQL